MTLSNRETAFVGCSAPLVVIDLAVDPEQPTDGDWRMAFAWGVTRHPKGDFVVDREFALSMIGSFHYLADTYGYRPPVCAEHDIDGAIYGLVEAIEVRDDGIWVLPRYNAEGLALASTGRFLYVSPSFFPEYQDPHSGLVLKNVLREFTYCSKPHQKNLQVPTAELYGLSEEGFTSNEDGPDDEPDDDNQPAAQPPQPEEEPDMDPEELSAALAAANAEIESLREQLANANGELEAMRENMGEDEPPEMAELSELSELRSAVEAQAGQITNLTQQLNRANAERRVADEAPGADEAQRAALVGVLLNDEASYTALLPTFATPGPIETAELGSVNGGPPRKPVANGDTRALVVEAHDKGVARGLPLIKFFKARGLPTPTDLNEIADQVYN